MKRRALSIPRFWGFIFLLLLSSTLEAKRLYAPVEKGCFANDGCFVTGYIAPATKLTIINDVAVSLYGINGGLSFSILNRMHAIGFGFVGYSLLNYKIGLDYHIPILGRPFLSRVRSDIQPRGLLEYFHTGIYVEWIFVPQEKVHGGLRLLYSRGQLSSSNTSLKENFWNLQPEFFFQANLTHWLQLDLGFQFRWMIYHKKHLTSFFDRSQLGTELRLRFGWFDVEPVIRKIK